MGDKNKTTCNVCLSTAALTTWSLATLQLLSMVYPLTNLSPATPLTPPTLLIVFECVHMLECEMCAGRSWRKPDLPPSSLQQRETFLFNEVQKGSPLNYYPSALSVCVCRGSFNSPSSSHHHFISSQCKQSVTSDYREVSLFWMNKIVHQIYSIFNLNFAEQRMGLVQG